MLFGSSSADIEGVKKLNKEYIDRRMDSTSLSKVSKVVNYVHSSPSFENISNCHITIVNVLDLNAATNVLSEFKISSWFELSRAKISFKDNIENIPAMWSQAVTFMRIVVWRIAALAWSYSSECLEVDASK